MTNFRSIFLTAFLILALACSGFAASTAVESARAHAAAGAFGCTVSGATNATPIVVACSAAHGLKDGDQVQIINVGGNTAANTTGYAKVTTVGDSTHFGLYSDAALATGVAGNGAYTSGGTASIAYDVSAVTGDWSVRVRIEGLTSGKKALLSVEDSVDGFATSQTLGVFNLIGTGAGPMVEYVIRSYQIPSARVGASNARLRFKVQSIDSSGTATVSWFFEQ